MVFLIGYWFPCKHIRNQKENIQKYSFLANDLWQYVILCTKEWVHSIVSYIHTQGVCSSRLGPILLIKEIM